MIKCALAVLISLALGISSASLTAGEVDAQLVDNECYGSLPESDDKCRDLINELSAIVEPDASKYVLLGRAYAGLAERGENTADRPTLKTASINALRAAIELEPNNLEALYGLAVASSGDEQLAQLRHILKLSPAYLPAVRSLSRKLSRSDSTEDHEEALQMLSNAYEVSDGQKKSTIAARAYKTQVDLGRTGQAIAFRSQVLREMGIDPTSSEDVEYEKQLSLACSNEALALDSADICFVAIRGLMASGDITKNTDDLNEAILLAINNVLPKRYEMQQTFPDAQLELRDLMEDLKLAGVDSLTFHLNYALVVSGERRVEALTRATEIEGSPPGQAASWLAESLLEMGEKDRAIELIQDLIENGEKPYSMIATDHLDRLEREKMRER